MTLRQKSLDLWRRFRPELILLGLSLMIILISLTVFAFVSLTKKPEIVFSSQKAKPAVSKGSAPKIVVDIQGAVEKSGAYEVSSGARLKDLLLLADGLSAAADREFFAQTFNLAKTLSDQEKIYIPSADEVAQGQVAGAASWEKTEVKINLNQADAAELETLPAIGPATAKKIIDNRPYDRLEDLLIKKVLSQSVFDKIKDKVSP